MPYIEGDICTTAKAVMPADPGTMETAQQQFIAVWGFNETQFELYFPVCILHFHPGVYPAAYKGYTPLTGTAGNTEHMHSQHVHGLHTAHTWWD